MFSEDEYIILKKIEYSESIIRTNPSKALGIANEIIKNNENSEIVMEASLVESKALWLLGNFEKSVLIANKLKEDALKLENYKICGKAHNIYGNVYYDLGNSESALESYMKGLVYARRGNDKATEAAIINNIGEIYNSYNALEDALRYYLESLELLKTSGNNSISGVVHMNIGELYFKQKEIEKAKEFVKVATDMFISNEDLIGLGYSHILIAKIYKYEKKYKESYKELKSAIDIMEQISEKYTLTKAYEIMVELLIEEKKFDEALDYCKDGLVMAKNIGASQSIANIELLIAKVYEEKGSYRKSLDYYKMYSNTRIKYEIKKQEEHKKHINAQIGIEKANHEKELYKIRNIELAKKSEEIEKLYKNVNTINKIGQAITSTLHLEKILYLLYDNIKTIMAVYYFGIIRYDSATGIIDSRLFLEDGKKIKIGKMNINDKNSLNTWCIKNREDIMLNDYWNEYEKYKKDILFNQNSEIIPQSIIMIPLIAQEKIIGAVTVQSKKKNAYTQYHFDMIKALGAYVSIAIKNSQESYALAIEIKERKASQKKLEVLNEKLSEISYYDSLSKIPNRRSFVDYLEREIARSIRKSEVISLLIIDIDYFKEYNDNYGHVKGDKCIEEIASILKKSVKRKVDFVARYGGDEFVAVLTNTDYDGAKIITEKIMHNIEKAAIEHNYSKVSNVITITIGGVSLIPYADETVEKLIHYADKSLYIAKGKGRNQYSFCRDI